jgi:PiT family inorganic phosphate transporter
MFPSLGIDASTALLLCLAIFLALSFEFVNGFHDTANAVATVIYTHALTPNQAVAWSGLWNLIGVLTSSGAVAFSIIALLPVELVIKVGSGAGFAMVFSILFSAIIWNVGTWYLGLPASSSHTLVGSIVGVGLMNSLLSPTGAFGEGVNWAKLVDTVQALVFSPLIGFVVAGLLVLLMKMVLRHRQELFSAPEGRTPPPWIRALLVLTCTGVSFAHGSNDGQKGMGLIVLILVGIVPTAFSLNLSTSSDTLHRIAGAATSLSSSLEALPSAHVSVVSADADEKQLTEYLKQPQISLTTIPSLAAVNMRVRDRLTNINSLSTMPAAERRALRMEVYLVAATLSKMQEKHQLPAMVDPALAAGYQKLLKQLTDYIPLWVKLAVSIALAMGTMIGWQRIVRTVGEKIGETPMTYAQGASAELVATATISAADIFGLPVSTTHILSSGVAGTMVAVGSGLQRATARNILLAWVLTLPVCVALGAALFAGTLMFVLHAFGIQ